MTALRSIARRVPGRDRLRRRPVVQRITRTLGAAGCVEESAGFTARELSGHRTSARYRLRQGGRTAVIRHPLLDMWVLEEIFRNGSYAFPEAVLERLRALGRPPRVLDLGGHVGLFGLYALTQFPDATVTSLEPDPSNARMLARCIAANGLDGKWRLVEACAAPEDGEAEFLSDYHLSRNASSPEVLAAEHESLERIFPFLGEGELLQARRRRVRAVDVFPFLREADLVKLDIQGDEWRIIRDPRFPELDATAIVLEYHPDGTIDERARALPEERSLDERYLEAVAEELGRGGYEVVEIGAGHDREGLCWACKRR